MRTQQTLSHKFLPQSSKLHHFDFTHQAMKNCITGEYLVQSRGGEARPHMFENNSGFITESLVSLER